MPVDVGHDHRQVSFGASSEAEQIAQDLDRYDSDGLQAFSDLSALEVLSRRHLMKRALDDGLTAPEIAKILNLRKQTVRYGLAHHDLIDIDGPLPRLPPWSSGRMHPRHVYRVSKSEPHVKRPSSWQ